MGLETLLRSLLALLLIGRRVDSSVIHNFGVQLAELLDFSLLPDSRFLSTLFELPELLLVLIRLLLQSLHIILDRFKIVIFVLLLFEALTQLVQPEVLQIAEGFIVI